MAETNAQGHITEQMHYHPFGEALNPSSEDAAGYTGHLFDSELGLNIYAGTILYPYFTHLVC